METLPASSSFLEVCHAMGSTLQTSNPHAVARLKIMHHLLSDTASECQSGYVCCYKSRIFAYAARTGHVPPGRHLIGEPARRVQLCRELVLRVKRDVQSFRSSRSQLNGSHTEGLMQSRVVHGDSHGYMYVMRKRLLCMLDSSQ